MQIICTVDIRTRELSLEDVTIAAFDHLVDDILFDVEPIDGFELETSTIKIAAVGPLGEPHDYEIDPSTVTVDEETGNINFVWSIPVGVTAMPLSSFKINDVKKITFAVCAEIVSGDNLVKAWHSNDGTIKVKAHLEPESGGGETPEEQATNAQKIGQLQTATAILQRKISGIASGTPPTADSTSEMDPDESTVYINTTDGNWYYWNGSAWQIGGVYGGAVTSTTFDKHGVPADDFAVGEALGGMDDRVTALESGSSGGLTADIKAALLACFNHVAWDAADPTGQSYINALQTALYPPANLSRITAVFTQPGTVYDTASLDSLRTNLVVTAYYDNSTSEVISNYTLSGTLSEGTSTITVSYGGKTDTFDVTVTSLMETITITWSGTGADNYSSIIDARTSDVYWKLPFEDGYSGYSSGATSESEFIKLMAALYSDAEGTVSEGYWYIDTQQVESTNRITVNKPSMPCNTQIKVAPAGYYVKFIATKRGGFSSNATCRTFLNTYATDIKLMHTGG